MDFIAHLPKTPRRFDSITTFVNGFSRWVHFTASKTTDSAVDMANYLLHEVLRHHGLPDSLVCYSDSHFSVKCCSGLTQLCGICFKYHLVIILRRTVRPISWTAWYKTTSDVNGPVIRPSGTYSSRPWKMHTTRLSASLRDILHSNWISAGQHAHQSNSSIHTDQIRAERWRWDVAGTTSVWCRERDRGGVKQTGVCWDGRSLLTEPL